MNMISDIMLKLTDRCNLDCDYCYMQNKNSAEISHHTALKIIQSINSISKVNYGRPMNVFISGGEVTLLPLEFMNWFFNALRTIPNLHLSINTNGTLFTQEHANLCKEFNVDVSLSLDGPAIIHNRHRSDSFDSVMTTLSFLDQEKIKYGLITVLDDFSFEHKEELYDFFKQIARNTKMNCANGHGSPEQYVDFLIWLSKKGKEDNHPFEEYNLFDIQRTIENKISHCTGCAWGNCYRDFIAVDFNGNVAMCERFFGFHNDDKKDYIIGNVNESNIIEIINNEKYNQFQRTLFLRKLHCMSCQYYKYCGSGCTYDYIVSNDVIQSCESRKRLFSNLIGG